MRYNLSEIVEVIKDRRTIRPEFYSDRKVHKEIVMNVLNSAIWAPTHGMTQPWRFKVFMEDGLKKLSDELPRLYRESVSDAEYKEEKEEKFRNRPLQVSVIIAICLTPDPNGKIPEIEEIEAVACGVQNMMLHCTAHGLGSFWSSPKLCYSEGMNEFLGLVDGEKCLGLFYMGYPAGEWPKSHRKPIEYVTEWISE